MCTRRILILIFFVPFAACSSGSSDPAPRNGTTSPPAIYPNTGSLATHFEGVWQGTVTPDASMTSSLAVIIVNGWGEFRLLTPDTQFVGYPRRTTADFEGELSGIRAVGTTWPDGSRVSLFDIAGTIDSNAFIDASYTGNNGGGTLALAWSGANLARHVVDVEGRWELYDADRNIVATFSVTRSGDWTANIVGMHSNGCNYSGELESWTSMASYDIWDLNISGCPMLAGTDVNGSYVGSAALLDMPDDGTGSLALVMALSNDNTQLTLILSRL